MRTNGLAALLALAMIAAAPATRAHPPIPVGDIGQWFDADAYPPEAISANEQGRVTAKVDVDATGKPTACAVTVTSGSFALDSGTCAIAMSRLTFQPAIDAAGRPVAGVFPLAVRWQSPAAARTPPPEPAVKPS